MKVPASDHPSNDSFFLTLTTSAIGGATGGYLCFPFEGTKKRLQSKALSKTDFYPQNFSNGKVLRAIHPIELYRGSMAFSVAVMTATTASMSFNALMKRHPSYDPDSKAWNGALAVSSGMLGAIVGSTPVENTILTQQLHRCGPVPALRRMFSQGITRPWVGVRELMAREAGFAGIMLYGASEVHRQVHQSTKSKKLAFASEIGICVLGAYLTHPADSLATYRQKLDGRVALTQAAKDMYKEGGCSIFFRGAAFRSLLFTGCTIIIPRTTEIVRGIFRHAVD